MAPPGSPFKRFAGAPAKPGGTGMRTRPIGESLAGDGGLASLLARVRTSQARLDSLSGMLPAGLREHLRAGPLDDEGWTILVPNSAVAAKLRHLLPMATDALADAGWPPRVLRVKVQPPGRPAPPRRSTG